MKLSFEKAKLVSTTKSNRAFIYDTDALHSAGNCWEFHYFLREFLSDKNWQCLDHLFEDGNLVEETIHLRPFHADQKNNWQTKDRIPKRPCTLSNVNKYSKRRAIRVHRTATISSFLSPHSLFTSCTVLFSLRFHVLVSYSKSIHQIKQNFRLQSPNLSPNLKRLPLQC